MKHYSHAEKVIDFKVMREKMGKMMGIVGELAHFICIHFPLGLLYICESILIVNVSLVT